MRWAAILLILLSGCATKYDPQRSIMVEWVRAEESQVKKLCEAEGDTSFFTVQGCAKWTENTCRIIAAEPKNEMDRARFSIMGHELMHCFDGAWHDRWGRKN